MISLFGQVLLDVYKRQVWYFAKKKPDIKKRNISIAVAAVGLLGTIFITPAVFKDNSNASTTTASTTIATSSSSSKTKESSSSSSSEVKTTAESSSETKQSTEPTTKNDGPEYTEAVSYTHLDVYKRQN